MVTKKKNQSRSYLNHLVLHRHIKIFCVVRGKDQYDTLPRNFLFGVQENRSFPSASKDHMQETRQVYSDSLEVGL